MKSVTCWFHNTFCCSCYEKEQNCFTLSESFLLFRASSTVTSPLPFPQRSLPEPLSLFAPCAAWTPVLITTQCFIFRHNVFKKKNCKQKQKWEPTAQCSSLFASSFFVFASTFPFSCGGSLNTPAPHKPLPPQRPPALSTHSALCAFWFLSTLPSWSNRSVLKVAWYGAGNSHSINRHFTAVKWVSTYRHTPN